MRTHRYAVLALAVVVGLIGWAGPVLGQAFPSRAIEFVVPFGAGGGSDILARAIAKVIAEEKLLPVPLVVSNRAGGSGAVGWSYVLSKKGDPYFLTTVSGSYWTTPLLGLAPFKPTDFTPVAGIALDTFFFVVRAESTYRTLRDIVEVARKSPELITVGGSAAASDDRVSTALLERAAGIKFNYIVFGGSGPALTNLLGGHISTTWLNPGEGLEQIRAGKVRALAVTSTERLKAFPNVPTFKELGYDVVWEQYRGVAMAPAVPPDAVKVMSDAFQRMCRTQRWQKEYIEANLLVSICQGPEAWGKTIEAVSERYVRMFRELAIIK
ncbi:MAG: hypothetical protein XU14_C0104G0005 [Armatimonadetes bacterium CSP1-3]|nr:MAG: hypothetical protein XU14_C0104G0005 [Armatimonadetes bacterium CSP1-3]